MNKLENAYRDAPVLQSPMTVDDRVLQAASKEVDSKISDEAPGYWNPGLAFATLCVIGVGIGLLLRTPDIELQMPPPPPMAPTATITQTPLSKADAEANTDKREVPEVTFSDTAADAAESQEEELGVLAERQLVPEMDSNQQRSSAAGSASDKLARNAQLAVAETVVDDSADGQRGHSNGDRSEVDNNTLKQSVEIYPDTTSLTSAINPESVASETKAASVEGLAIVDLDEASITLGDEWFAIQPDEHYTVVLEYSESMLNDLRKVPALNIRMLELDDSKVLLRGSYRDRATAEQSWQHIKQFIAQRQDATDVEIKQFSDLR